MQCLYTVTGAVTNVAATGGRVSLSVETAGACAWTASSTAAFAEVSAGSSGTGNGTVTVQVAANTGDARSASLLVAGHTLTLSQQAAGSTPSTPPPASPCTYAVTAGATTFGSAGGTTTVGVRVTSGSACTWNTSPRDSFLTVPSGASGSGDGQATIAVAPNGGGARTGTVVVAGQAITISQTGGSACITSLSPATQSIPAWGGPATVRVTAPSTCAWTAASDDGFITVPATTVVGDGTVTVNVSANTVTAPRTGTIKVGTSSVGLTQAGFTEPAAVFSFSGQAKESILPGASRRFVYTSSSQFTATIDAARQELRVRGSFSDGSWTLSLGAPAGGVLAPGFYNNTTRFPFHPLYGPNAGLEMSGEGRGCNQSLGRFQIAELVITNGLIQRLHVVAEQHCNYSSPTLSADIWVDAGGSTTVPAASLPPIPSSPTSFLTVTGDPGDPRLNGQTRTYTIQSAVITPRAGSARLFVTTAGISDSSDYLLTFSAAGPSRPGVGTYDNATGSGSSTAPGLEVSGNGAACFTSSSTGKFTILEVAYGSAGPAGDQLLRLHATFEQHCNGAAAGIKGEVYVVADPWR